jgi:hypothetical protein
VKIPEKPLNERTLRVKKKTFTSEAPSKHNAVQKCIEEELKC